MHVQLLIQFVTKTVKPDALKAAELCFGEALDSFEVVAHAMRCDTLITWKRLRYKDNKEDTRVGHLYYYNLSDAKPCADGRKILFDWLSRQYTAEIYVHKATKAFFVDIVIVFGLKMVPTTNMSSELNASCALETCDTDLAPLEDSAGFDNLELSSLTQLLFENCLTLDCYIHIRIRIKWYQQLGLLRMSAYGRDRRHPHRRGAAGGNGHEQRDPRDIAEIERLQQRVRELEINQFHKEDDSGTESVIWEDEDDGFQNAEFAYNRSNHSSTGRSPFFVVYGRNPFTPLDLAPIPAIDHYSVDGDEQAAQIKLLHEQVREQIVTHNLQYQARANKHRRKVVFNEGDLVWVYLRRERFPQGRFGKLQPRADGPFRVLQRINDNAYKIDLPGHYKVSATFNVADLSPYVPDDKDDSRSSPFLEGEDDTDLAPLEDSAGFDNLELSSVADIKTRAEAMKCLTAFSKVVGTGNIGPLPRTFDSGVLNSELGLPSPSSISLSGTGLRVLVGLLDSGDELGNTILPGSCVSLVGSQRGQHSVQAEGRWLAGCCGVAMVVESGKGKVEASTMLNLDILVGVRSKSVAEVDQRCGPIRLFCSKSPCPYCGKNKWV
ncbi:hypothetical protein E3N88_16553 [Mikania micrantha]|uniref:Tf2-1-like SH3-like domain-containing protein n=1 Tax=Mikania micrantha TaxID=192012 RepID=A0A5N6P0T6_9ASTR|nr:hypothetical protein E3N88_16553 [Mikania micrantha]